MLVQVIGDNYVKATEELSRRVQASVETVLERFAELLTRVEVHLADMNSHKGGSNDKRCQVEARPRGHQPLSATHYAGTVDDAVDGALERLQHELDHTFGRLHQHKGLTSMGGDQTV